MLYSLLKLPARLAFFFYCRKLVVHYRESLKKKGPLLIAANHPNAFLDAIIIATLFKAPVNSLTRGDAFANGFYSKLLRSLNMLPVYRLSEGAENIDTNYTTFSACIDIFKKGGIVLIFSEGECVNEWDLRPLKKGTARLALTAWQQGIPLEILPVGINYNSYRSFGKNIGISFGQSINNNDIQINTSPGLFIAAFNSLLLKRLSHLVYQKGNTDLYKDLISVRPTPLQRAFLFLPSAIGYFIHYPLMILGKSLIKKKDDDMYDSILIGILFVFYPLYLLLITLLIYFVTSSAFSFVLLLLLPLTALAHLKLMDIKKPIKF